MSSRIDQTFLSTDVYLGTTTTTTTEVNCGGGNAAEKDKHTLIYPDTILTSELAAAERLIETLPDALRQPVLDEWTGIIKAGAIKSSTIGCLRALVERAIDGRFTPERGLRIRESRKSQQRLEVVLQKDPICRRLTKTISMYVGCAAFKQGRQRKIDQ